MDNMEYDYSKLIGKIAEKCGTKSNFAKQMGLSERTVSLKLNNKISWKQTEMAKAVKVHELKQTDIQAYFFKLKVQECEL